MKGANAGVDGEWNLASTSWYKIFETCILTIAFLSGSNCLIWEAINSPNSSSSSLVLAFASVQEHHQGTAELALLPL